MRCFPALMVLVIAAAASAADRPNVILIMTDDQGFSDVGANGNTIIRTPNIDALATRATQMKYFYVCPVCTPTRATLMTGRWNYRTRAIDTFQGRAMMEPDEVTVAEMLRPAGYATGIFGKWHLGDCYPMRPQDQGFDETLVIHGGGIGQPTDAIGGEGKYTDPIVYHNGQKTQAHGYCTDVYFDGAMDWMEKQHKAGKPFFVYLPTNAPHGPYHDVPPVWYEYYKTREISEKTLPHVPGHPLGNLTDSDTLARVYAMISNIDDNLGRLFARLDELKITDNTLVIFITDNGPATKGYNAGMQGNKSTTWQGGVRSFFYAQWPGHLKGGVVEAPFAAHIDVLPTILEACGVPRPADVKLDGRSILPLLEGRKVDWPARSLFFQSHRGDEPELYRNFAVQTADWKLLSSGAFGGARPAPKARKTEPAAVTTPTGAAMELYHISADPLELHDVAAQNPAIVADLKRQYEAWFKDVGSTRPDNYAPPRILIGTEHETTTTLSLQDSRGATTPREPGYWEVTFTRPGDYEFTVITEEVKEPATAQVMLGDRPAASVEVKPGQIMHTAKAHFDAAPGAARLSVKLQGPRVRFLKVTGRP